MRNGVAYGEFAEIAKEVYVKVAATDFKVEHRKMSQARIAILTGLTRKEVSRLYGDKNNKKGATRSNLNRVTRVLTGWHTDAEFTGPYGLPLELKFEGEPERDFTSLVQRYSGDMAPRAMLDELLRIGSVIETDTGWFKVLSRTYLPEVDAPDSLDLLGSEVERFVSTIDHNIREKDPINRNFERHVHADDGIKAEDLPRFRAYIKKRAQQLLEEVDNWLSNLDAPDKKKDKVVHTGLGIFHYVEDKTEKNSKE